MLSGIASKLNEFSARLATFQIPYQLDTRRSSNSTQPTKKKNGGTIEWPHQLPSAESLARAGFFYKPASDSLDNVQCFTCHVKLDGWEPADDPIREHLAHSDGCAWATAISVIRDEDSQQDPESRDPLSEEMADARYATFQSGHGWPHEGRKGWKCKTSKMVAAGWAWDPNDESEDRDGVTCFYCNLSLDGWEPKDDPFVEHKRREPECPFFILLEQYHGAEVANGKAKQGKGRGKAATARTSTASKASRLSVQSAMSEDLAFDGSLAGADDSIGTTATTVSQATTNGVTKGKKKVTKAMPAAKGTKGKKKAPVEDDAMEINYPELDLLEERVDEEDFPVKAPPKATRKATRTVSKQLDSSVVEISQVDIAPLKKTTRGRKPKAKPQPEQEPEEILQTPDADAIAKQRLSEVSAQLQDELDNNAYDSEPLDQSTPAVEIPMAKRGTKRTSDGLAKQRKSNSSAFEVVVPAQPAVRPAAKGKRGRKPKQASTASADAELEKRLAAEIEDVRMEPDMEQIEAPEPEPPAKKARGRPKGASNTSARSSHTSQASSTAIEPDAQPDELATHQNEPKPATKKSEGKTKGKKGSSARSSQSSQVHATDSLGQSEVKSIMQPDEPENMTMDELEIEHELERIATEQASHETSQEAMETEQNQTDEYETSPSQGRLSKDSAEIQQLEQEIQKEDENAVDHNADRIGSPPRLSLGLEANKGFTFSPNGSDKENQPSSVVQHFAKQPQPPVSLSPTKTKRVPLVPGTPNRSPRRMLLSPSKAEFSRLTSNAPWHPVDLETVLLTSPQSTPGRVEQQLVNAAGALSSPEKKMTVEQWIRYRAEQSEETLRRKCEQMVAIFEKEGMRGLEALNGINVLG